MGPQLIREHAMTEFRHADNATIDEILSRYTYATLQDRVAAQIAVQLAAGPNTRPDELHAAARKHSTGARHASG